MSIFDKIAAAVAPLASPEERAEARRNAEGMVQGGDDWLGLALDHHRQIERLFEQAGNGTDASSRQSASRQLATVLTGHANAEEAVLYPMLAEDHKGHAAMAYQEQAMTKIELHKLEMLDPMSQEWTDKLEHIKSAVQQHVYEEESSWFGEVREAMGGQDEAMHARRFREEFDRYMGGGDGEQPMQMAASMGDSGFSQSEGQFENGGSADQTNFTQSSREDAGAGSAGAGDMSRFGQTDDISQTNQRSSGNDY